MNAPSVAEPPLDASPPRWQRRVASSFALVAVVIGSLGLVGRMFVYGGPHGYIHLLLFLPMSTAGLGLAGAILVLDRRGRSKALLTLGVILIGAAIWFGLPLVLVAWALVRG